MVAGMKTLLLAALSLCTSTVLGQGYPAKPVRLMIGYAPGGAAEAGARAQAREVVARYVKWGRVVKDANIRAD